MNYECPRGGGVQLDSSVLPTTHANRYGVNSVENSTAAPRSIRITVLVRWLHAVLDSKRESWRALPRGGSRQSGAVNDANRSTANSEDMQDLRSVRVLGTGLERV